MNKGPSKAIEYRLYNELKYGRLILRDEKRSGRPLATVTGKKGTSSENFVVNEVRVDESHIADRIGNLQGHLHEITTRWIPQISPNAQKHVVVVTGLLSLRQTRLGAFMSSLQVMNLGFINTTQT